MADHLALAVRIGPKINSSAWSQNMEVKVTETSENDKQAVKKSWQNLMLGKLKRMTHQQSSLKYETVTK